jgi:tRNA(Ile)-lysidine synthase
MAEHQLIKKIEHFIDQHHLIGAGQTVIVGLSGGPDSVFLLHVLHRLLPVLDIKIVAAHLDHGWRKTSTHDVAFCRELCEKLNVTFVSAHASEFGHIKKNGSQEDYGRQLRRAFFQSVAQSLQTESGDKPRIALAHHQDDQIETFFIRLIRGAGIRGLAGMKPQQDNYIRPLLCVSKTQIVAYCDEHKIAYLIDETNVQETYLRNRIRGSVIPALTAADKRFKASCLKTIEHLADADEFIETMTRKAIDECSRVTSQGHQGFDLKKFKALHPFIQKRFLMSWLIEQRVPFTPTAAFFNELMRFLISDRGGKHRVHEGWGLVKQQWFIWIETKS